MNDVAIQIAGRAVTGGELVLAAAGTLAILLVLVVLAFLAAGAYRSRQSGALEERLAEMARSQAEMNGRFQTMHEVFATRYSELSRGFNERLDGFGHRLGQNLETQTRATHDSLTKLNERLAVIDEAQRNITDLSKEMVNLQQILANKQARGAFGQGLMEAIVRDGLPDNAFRFQATLSNGRRPDCVVDLPGSEAGLVIDAKFPLEAFTAYREASGEEERKGAAQRLRIDVLRHVSDIRERYLLPGETQDLAFLFVPSESVYADLHEHFDDVIQKAQRQRVVVVGPSMLMLAISVMQTILRDQRLREQAHVIHKEVGLLSDDVRRLRDRVDKLQTHFGQARGDLDQIVTSADKIVRRGARIEEMDFGDAAPEAGARQLRLAGE